MMVRIGYITGLYQYIEDGSKVIFIGIDTEWIETEADINHEVIHSVLHDFEEEDGCSRYNLLDNIWWKHKAVFKCSRELIRYLSGLAQYGLGFP